jgi:hypothetical protein
VPADLALRIEGDTTADSAFNGKGAVLVQQRAILITRQFVNKETRHRQGIVGSIRGMKKGPIAQRARLASIRQRLFRLFQ